jgi:hypothetical protein
MAAEDKKISELNPVQSSGGAELTEVVKDGDNFKRKNNMTASAAPTVTDDSAADYAIGSFWHYNGSVWVCRNNAAGAAVWVRMGAIESTTLDVSIADGVATVDLPYKVYSALITQTGTDAPVATVLQNTLGFTPTWAYNAQGSYILQSVGQWTANVELFLGASNDGDPETYTTFTNRIIRFSSNEIRVATGTLITDGVSTPFNVGIQPSDNALYETLISIKLYA